MKTLNKHLRIFLLCIFLGTFLTTMSQNVKVVPDARLYQCYSKQYIDNLLVTNPKQISYLNYFLDNSYYIVSLKSAEKPIEGIDVNILKHTISKVTFNEKVYNQKTFNILKYNFMFGELSAVTYIWKDAGIAIVLRPDKHIREDFNLIKQ